VSAVPRPPALSPAEAARTVVAGGSRAAIRSLTLAASGALPGDITARVAAWVEIHRTHLTALSDTVPASFPAGSPAPAVPDTLRQPDPVRGLAGLLHGLEAGAVHAAAAVPGAAALYVGIAAARGAQDRQLRTAAGLPVATTAWPDGTPVDVLQAVLAAEHAVVDGYTTAAAWDPGRRDRFVAAAVRHEVARDGLAALVAGTGATPVTAAPGYAVPSDAVPGVGTVTDRATALAVAVETGLARAAVAAAASFLTQTPAGTGEADGAASPGPGAADDPAAVTAALAATAAEAEVARQAWGAAAAPLPGS
jgi:hypothetical protein